MIVAHVQTPLVFVQPLAAISDASAANTAKQAVAPQKAVPQVKRIEMGTVDRIHPGKGPSSVHRNVQTGQNRLNVSVQSTEGNGSISSPVGLSSASPPPAPRGDLIGTLLTSFS